MTNETPIRQALTILICTVILPLCGYFGALPIKSACANITAYRPLYGKFSSEDKALRFLATEAPKDAVLIEEDSNWLIVGAATDSYEAALPNGAPFDMVKRNHDFAKQYHSDVFAFDIPEKKAAALGIEVEPTPLESLADSISGDVADVDRYFEECKHVINRVAEREQAPDATTEGLASQLISIAPKLIQLRDSDLPRQDAAFVRFWLGKGFYLRGLELHKTTRASKTATGYYRSAGLLFREVADSYAGTELHEDALYHAAAIAYHLTRQGHPVKQLREAVDAYKEYLAEFPEGEYSHRAQLNLAGLSLELCNIDVENDEKAAILFALDLLERENELNEYVTNRIKNILIESIISSQIKNRYHVVLGLADQIRNLADKTKDSVLRCNLLANIASVEFAEGRYAKCVQDAIQLVPPDSESFSALSEPEKRYISSSLRLCLKANDRAEETILDEPTARKFEQFIAKWMPSDSQPGPHSGELGKTGENAGGTEE